MMSLDGLYISKRTGKTTEYPEPVRSEFQRDFDRLIFSSAFRRLQNKTQVFPLPGSAFVHNRLTHSLEVASVGKSLGKLAGSAIVKKGLVNKPESIEFYNYELANVIAAACLAHDIGNPAFGHSGESAISHYFEEQGKDFIECSPKEWKDLTNFEGNANALRVLTNSFAGSLPGGQRLTYTTLATIIKYPCESVGSDDSKKHLKKYNFFQTEKEIFLEIAKLFGLILQNESPIQYCRHPFAYLLEAADDITYTIIDFEDAHRLHILEEEEIIKYFKQLITCINRKEDKITELMASVDSITNANEKISYLRSRAINCLILECNDIFMANLDDILKGTFNNTLTGLLKDYCNAFKEIEIISFKKIYNHRKVVELELAGYNVMYELLSQLIPSVLLAEEDRKKKDKKNLSLIPLQFGPFDDNVPPYLKCLRVIDYLSGMTDIYATEFYRKIKGIEIGHHG